MRATYNGAEPQTYPQYLDLDAEDGPRTLVAKPGGTYDIAQADGLTVPGEPDAGGNTPQVEIKLPMPPDNRWTAERTRVSAKES